MTRDPIRRRFGRGAARLRIGWPRDGERLSKLARRAIRLERRLTVVPFTTAALILWLLVTTPPLVRDDATRPSATQLVVETWSEPSTPKPDETQARPRAEVPTKPNERRPAPSLAQNPPRTRPRADHAVGSLAARGAAAASSEDPHSAARPSARSTPAPLDVAALATKGARWSDTGVLSERAAVRALPDPASLPSAVAPDTTRQADQTFAAALARGASRTRARAEAATDAMAGHRAVAVPSDARPTAVARPIAARRGERELAAVNTRDAGERRSFLENLARNEASRTRGDGGDPASHRPRVSAARTSPSLFSGGHRRGQPGGWQEVPLDALPDCTPAGRQDLLKKRILLAVPERRECSSRAGSFRFVEARTLGAFLMWSRPNPDARAGQPRDRDACDVLERALACLREPEMQESKSR